MHPAVQDQQAVSFLAALRSPRNGWVVVGNPSQSRLVGQFFEYTHPMGRALSGTVPEAGGATGRDIIWNWIKAACPIPGLGSARIAAPDARFPDTPESRIAATALARTTEIVGGAPAPKPGPRLRHGMGGYVH